MSNISNSIISNNDNNDNNGNNNNNYTDDDDDSDHEEQDQLIKNKNNIFAKQQNYYDDNSYEDSSSDSDDDDGDNYSNSDIEYNSNNVNKNSKDKKTVVINKKSNHSPFTSNDVIYKSDPFQEKIPTKSNNKTALPFTFYRGFCVILCVVIYLVLAVTYFFEFRFLSIHPAAPTSSTDDPGREQAIMKRDWVYYLFLINRPLVLVPLLIILPLYALNNAKTIKYSLFIAVAICLSIVGDCLYSFQISVIDSSMSEIYKEMIYFFYLVFYMLSKLFYTVAFIVGIGKRIKIRLFQAIPFYTYAATLVLLVVFSKTIAPMIITPSNIPESGFSLEALSTSSSSTSSLVDIDPTHLSLIIIYSFVEATLMWRAVSLTSSFPGSNPTRLLLWLNVLGSLVFCITDTLILINQFYYRLNGIFYYSTGGIWLGHALIAFSTPRRLDVREYIFKVFGMNTSKYFKYKYINS
ncbi:hypothetical protein CYY_002914 [Polysphondylium violaceum]|uniref:Transmembrane protein n=1 Tax=Polysphondylium violaceum TaxID=133409 RepID=A0A8J4UUQ9_9MYCE|nr:hypothetical protein CYY_002914 [Polysphondylium violaceum]